ncbi:MAG: MATE family efflux transporter [Prevotellaceae bacterium]|jgi:putative MATE family efflux protein|nr:MATE family efflux transporter [Prevotellaceae bacterium]
MFFIINIFSALFKPLRALLKSLRTEQTSSSTLGSGNVRKLLSQYSIPAIIAMTASSLYNMTDSIFIGQGVGPLAIAGLAVTFPFMNLAAAFGSLVGIGASTLISIKLGQKDHKSANLVLGNVLTLNIILGLLLTLVCLPFLDPILYFFGASKDTVSYAHDYMEIVILGNVITHIYFGLNAALRSAGFPTMSMFATLLSVVVNCILTPVFIFWFHWGIRGAAWATILSQVISLILQLVMFSNKKHVIYFHKGIYQLRKELVKNIFSIGLSPFLMNGCACIIVIIINRGLSKYGGDFAIGAYGIVNRIVFLFIMIIMGFNQGMQPIAGYNYGARNFLRVTEVTKLTILYAVGIATAGFLVCEIVPGLIIRLFTTHQELINESIYGLRIVFAIFPLVGFQMVATNFFMSIGASRKAIFLSLTRQVLFLTPCLLILPGFWGTTGIWLSLPISDFVSTVFTAILLIREFKKFKTLTITNRR